MIVAPALVSLVEVLDGAPPFDHQLGRRERIGEVAGEHAELVGREPSGHPGHDDTALREERAWAASTTAPRV